MCRTPSRCAQNSHDRRCPKTPVLGCFYKTFSCTGTRQKSRRLKPKISIKTKQIYLRKSFLVISSTLLFSSTISFTFGKCSSIEEVVFKNLSSVLKMFEPLVDLLLTKPNYRKPKKFDWKTKKLTQLLVLSCFPLKTSQFRTETNRFNKLLYSKSR